MSGAGDWSARQSRNGQLETFRLFERGQALSFKRLFSLLGQDENFSSWYTKTLADSAFPAFFWEHPPLNADNIDSAAEFVLVDAPALATVQQDAAAFQSRFSDEPVVSFRNLGGDALLIAPTPADASTDYSHLAAFLRTAGEDQVQALWRLAGQSVMETLSDKPLWLSTSGLGVAWLHLRLDASPKYYQHLAYRQWPPTGRPQPP